jgi:hypothetical protein
LDRRHEVIGTGKLAANVERVRALGEEPVVLDLLGARAVRRAVLGAEPEAIVHEATALADVKFSRNLDRSFVETNRLRTVGTDNLAWRQGFFGAYTAPPAVEPEEDRRKITYQPFAAVTRQSR